MIHKGNDNERRPIEELGLIELGKREFGERISMDTELKEFILRSRNLRDNEIGFREEYYKYGEIDTEESYLMRKEAESYFEN